MLLLVHHHGCVWVVSTVPHASKLRIAVIGGRTHELLLWHACGHHLVLERSQRAYLVDIRVDRCDVWWHHELLLETFEVRPHLVHMLIAHGHPAVQGLLQALRSRRVV
jgi:hypothetical protein